MSLLISIHFAPKLAGAAAFIAPRPALFIIFQPMSRTNLQLLLRFTLELIALFAYGSWGWSLDDGFMRHIYAGAIPAVVMAIWGVFNVPGDPSRSGNAPVRIDGGLRFVLEIAMFTGAGYAIYVTGHGRFAALFLIITSVHYMMTWSRVKWLFSQKLTSK
jgi:Protein of unknown function (DUF2568)